jgi:hypothetical protein
VKASPLLLVCLFVLFLAPQTAPADISCKKVSIENNELNFIQTFKAIAEQLTISIKLKGPAPKGKHTISLSGVPLNEAIPKIISVYGAQNYAIVYDDKIKSITLSLIGEDSSEETSPTQIEKNSENFRSMTEKEFKQLQPNSTENFRSMTEKEFKQLQPNSTENFRSMTEKEFKQLQPNSTENYRSMTRHELARLKSKSQKAPENYNNK